MVRPAVDQHVGRLRCADAVKKDLLVVVQALELRPFLRLVVAAVEEALVVLRPARAGKLGPLDMVRQVLARLDVPHLPFVPVRPGDRNGIGEELRVVADVKSGGRYRAIFRQQVRIEEHAVLALNRGQRVEHVLVLQPVVAQEKVTRTSLEESGVALEIP